MKFLVLTALIAAVASGPLSSESNDVKTEWPWQVGKLYRYDVESYTLARLDEGSSTGTVFRAKLIIRVRNEGKLQARLENAQYASIHQQLHEDKIPKDLKYEVVKELEKPFEISVDGGRVLSMNLPSSLSVPKENLLKGLMSALQVDLSAHRIISRTQNQYDKESHQGQFKKMETDVTGDCETLYTVVPVAAEWRRELQHFSMKEDPIEISKSKNYAHCHRRVAYHFGVPEGAVWTKTVRNPQDEQLINRATTSRILAGQQGTIFKAETISTVHVHPHVSGKQKAEVLSKVKLILNTFEDDSEAEWQKPEGTRVAKNLLYSVTSKQIDFDDNSSSSESDEHNSREEVRRSYRSKFISINKVIIEGNDDRRNHDSSSEDYATTFMNDEMPSGENPPHTAMYLVPESLSEKKLNPMKAQKLIQEIAQQLQNPNNMPKADFLTKFNILVRIISSMTYEQLSQTSRSIETAKSSNDIVKADMWMIYRDAVVQAGTIPAFKQIQSWIENRKIKGEEAAQVLASLVTTLRYPTTDVMKQFFNLAMSPEVSQQKYLNNTALISATRFMNMAQINNYSVHSYYPTYMYGRFARKHDNFIYEEVFPRLREGLDQAMQNSDSVKSQVYIRALGNLGHPIVLDIFTPYLEGRTPTTKFLRAFMIYNLQTLAHKRDVKVRSALFNILRNTAEPYEVRVAAAQAVLIARPSSAMMKMMAQMTHDDPSIQVRATIKSGIESAAQIKDQRYWDLIRTAQAALPMLTKEDFGLTDSSQRYFNLYDSELGVKNMVTLKTTGSDDHLMPKNLKFSVKQKTTGWNSVSARVSSVEQFVNILKDQMDTWQRNPKSEANFKYSAEKISELLNIKRNPREQLEAGFDIKLMNQERYFAFSEDDLKQLPGLMREYMTDLSTGIEKHYTKVFNQAQIKIMFPVAAGMPFIYSYKEPTVVHMQAKAKGQINWNQERGDTRSSFEKELQFTYARNIDGSVGFFDTLSDQYASAGMVNKVQFNIPIKVQIETELREVKIHLEPLRKDQDTTLLHYSVWPYTSVQKKDTLIPVSLDPNTKPIARENKISSIDTKFGQQMGLMFHIQGYSYSSDYVNIGKLFQSPDLLANIPLILYQKDIALTHYNFRYLGKQSENKRITITGVLDTHLNVKESGEEKLSAKNYEHISPNSEARRKEMVERVTSGINTPKARVLDLSVSFEGPRKTEYVLTAAMGDSHVDQKIQYAFFAARNSAEENNQVNGVGKVIQPMLPSLDPRKTLQRDLKMSFDAEINGPINGKVQIQSVFERSTKYTEALKNHPMIKQCEKEISRGNKMDRACYTMLYWAYIPDYLKATVTYADVSPAVKFMTYQATRMAEYFGFWYSDMNPLKKSPEGKLEIEAQAFHFEKMWNLALTSRFGELRFKKIPLNEVSQDALTTLSLFQPHERVLNYYSRENSLPFCIVDNTRIKTFSNRTFSYTLSRAWHVLMQDMEARDQKWQQDNLVVLTRRPSESQQEMYISYKTESGKEIEIELQPAADGSNKPKITVNTNAERISNGDLVMYAGDDKDYPLMEFLTTRDDGIVIMRIKETRLVVVYDGERVMLLADGHRKNIRGVCGQMSGDPRDDYKTPRGLVDKPEHFAASYAIKDESDPKTMELKKEAEQLAYQPSNKYTVISKKGSQWQELDETVEDWGVENVFRARSYSKKRSECQVQQQVQYYEKHGQICITTTPIDSCQSQCSGKGYKVQAVQVVCRPKSDEEFQQYRNEIRQGLNPEVSGAPQIKEYNVPSSCRA